MKTYYINNGKENGGPFSFEELKNQTLNKTTLVWFQGMDEWQHAQDIEELKSFFIAVPPPIKRPTIQPERNHEKRSSTILGLKKSYFFLALLFLAILITVFVLNSIQNKKRSELDLKNKQSEFSNEKIILEQNEFNEERIQNEIRERIAVENNNLRLRDSINSRITEIKRILVENKSQLERAKKELIDVEQFKFFRSENEKTEQIRVLQNDYHSIETQMTQLNNESDRLYLQLETIH